MTLKMTNEEKKAIDTIRTLSMDAVQQANSGHPGTAMALAPVAYLLYTEVMKFNPAQANCPARDRFVLSIGHASALIYSLLHLTQTQEIGHDGKPTGKPAVSLDDLKQFRQLGSKCAGHPEYGHVTGVEMTTGPLGQGCATSVGIALAQRWIATNYDDARSPMFDNNVFVLCGDGCMMEGVTSEAASLAGHLRISNLCWIYDSNDITIEGDTNLAFTENVRQRFEAYGWCVETVADANDLDELRKAFERFKENCNGKDGRPTLIVVKSRIAFGAPKLEGSHEAHGAPLGDEEIRGAKKFYGFDPDKKFNVDSDVYETFTKRTATRGNELTTNFQKRYDEYQRNFPDGGKVLAKLLAGELPDNWAAAVAEFPADAKGIASRISSGKVLNQLASNIPFMLGGSADLAPSNKTDLTFEGAGEIGASKFDGRNIHFGIREHAMAAIANGMVLLNLKAYCSTFFVFADYMRPSIRLAALMRIPTLFIFTHDSIGVGEDGPTHQPIEQLASLRAIPNVAVFRPADANEVAEAYKAAVTMKATPSCLVFTRQNLPTLDRKKFAAASSVQKGGYVLADAKDGKPELILIATGSEVGLCVEAYEKLTAEGKKVRVVSLPCWELFEAQTDEYKESVLPKSVTARVGVELGVEQGWRKYIGDKGQFLGMTGFGASAPAGTLLKHYGFTVENLCEIAKRVL